MFLLGVGILCIFWLSQTNSIILTANNIAEFIQINDLNFKGIKGIDKKALTNFNSKILDLDNNAISVLSSDLLEDNPHFTNVSFFRNYICEIGENSFQGLRNLTYINLSFNEIHKLPAEIFKGNVLLVSISLRSNSLSVIPEETFINNRNVVFLDLAENNLLKFDYTVLLRTTKLKILYLEENKLTEFNYSLLREKFKKLRDISLTGNRFNCTLARRMDEFLKKENIVSVVEFTKPSNISCIVEMNNTLRTQKNTSSNM